MFAIIGFTIKFWPEFPKMQSLNHTIKDHPTVLSHTSELQIQEESEKALHSPPDQLHSSWHDPLQAVHQL